MEHEHNGEHFSPIKTDQLEIEVNLDRYLFALSYLKDKTVIDLGCGAGLGTFLYSMVAKKVYAVDYDAKTLEYASKYPYAPGKVEFLHLDIREKDDLEKLPAVDVCVALEVLEHVENPALVLKHLRATQLVFSMPLYSMEVSSWHRFPTETEEDIRKLISPFYDIGRYEEQSHPIISGRWIRGEGIRLI